MCVLNLIILFKVCQEYAQYVYEWITSPVQIFNAGKIKVNKCGHKVTELIIGGQVSGVREFPHMVSQYMKIVILKANGSIIKVMILTLNICNL